MPTLGEFIKLARKRFGAEHHNLILSVPGEAAQFTPCLLRNGPAEVPYLAVLPALRMDQVLQPEVLQSLCRLLGIPVEDIDPEFGLLLPDA